MGCPPISTIGLGRTALSSLMRVPKPPARMTACMVRMVLSVKMQRAYSRDEQKPSTKNDTRTIRPAVRSGAICICSQRDTIFWCCIFAACLPGAGNRSGPVRRSTDGEARLAPRSVRCRRSLGGGVRLVPVFVWFLRPWCPVWSRRLFSFSAGFGAGAAGRFRCFRPAAPWQTRGR